MRAIRWTFLVTFVGVVALTNSQQPPQKRAIDDGPERIQLADTLINKDKTQRQTKRTRTSTTPRPLGFFGTIWKLLVDQVNDTRSAYGQLSVLFNNQFSDTQVPTVELPIAGDDSSTTTEAPARISRKEFLDILRRNIIGLRRLNNLEWREAIADSKKNIQEYRKEFNRELYKQFRDDKN